MLTPLQVIRDLRAIIGDAAREFTFDGSIHTGRITVLSSSRPLEIGGYQPEPTLTLIIALSDEVGNRTFVERPKSGDLITIESISYRVIRAETDPHESMLTLELGTAAK